MESYETLIFEEKDGVAWIRLHRPEEMNAVNLPMARELCRATAYCTGKDSIRAVVLTGAGRVFSVGGDVKDMVGEVKSTDRPDLFLRDLAMHVHGFVAELYRMPKPVVAAVNGVAAGVGFSMSMACDLALASEKARFVLAYTNIGLVPDGGCTYSLTRLVGSRKALEIMYLNEPIGAEEALGLGLVNRVIAAEQFEEQVAAVAQKLAHGPTETYGRAKGLVHAALSETLESQLEGERQGNAISGLRPEFREGLTAFVEKRKADFRSLS